MQDMAMVREVRAQGTEPVSIQELAIRRDLAAAYRLAAIYGWDDMIGTHFTARLPHEAGRPEAFLINPYGLMFDEVTASNLVKVDVDGNILAGDHPVNKAGFVIHSAIHAARADAMCVLHLHTGDGVAVSAIEDGLLPLNQLSMTIANKIAFHEYEGPVVDPGEKDRLIAHLGDRHFMLLRNHGTMTLGGSIAEAFHAMYVLEKCCTWQVRTLGMNLAVHHPDPKVVRDVDEKWGQRNASMENYARNLVWPALLRKLDREAPGYKD